MIVERRGSGDYVVVNNQNGNAADGIIHDNQNNGEPSNKREPSNNML